MSVSDKISLKHTHTGNVLKLPASMLYTRNDLRRFELLKAVRFKIIFCLIILNITNVMYDYGLSSLQSRI
jgi:hypothetical protein